MTVNLVGCVDYSQWKKLDAGEKSTVATNSVETNSAVYVNNQADAYVSSSGETCTDGKDDGKIGFFSALGNAVKGIGKTVVNGIKGMFTDSEGKFSLGKTLLSVGTAALCIAVPAVGVAACAVGGVMGAVQVGKGVYNAATAETDAQAKEAWQNIGGGTFSVAASVVGAKAGIKAVKATSSAGGAKGISALDQLDDAANIGQKAVALGKDMVSSTKNQCSSIKTSATAYAKTAQEGIKGYKQKKNINKAKAEMNTAKTSTDYNIEQAKSEYNVSVDTKQKIAKFETTKNNIVDYAKHPLETAKNAWQTASGKVTKENASQIWKGIKSAPKTVSDAASNLTGTPAKIYQALTSGETTYAQAVQKYGYDNVAQVLQYLGGTLFATENA